MKYFKKFKSNSRVRDNVEQQLFDKDGNVKLLFQENLLGQYILFYLRKLTPDPITHDGQVKPGLLNYLAAYGLRIPFLTGTWGDRRFISNGITNAGRAVVSGLINGSGTPAAFTYVAVGTGVVGFSASDTALGTESAASGLTRAAGSVSLVTTSITNDTAQITKTFTVTGSVAVTEAGLFNASSSVTLLARQTFSAINVVNGDSLAVTWKIQNT